VNTAPDLPCLYTIDTTVNLGLNVPAADDYTNDRRPNTGTSFSAPIVSGIASLMLAVNGNLRGEQLFSRLQAASRPFPTSNVVGGLPTCRVPDGVVQDSECICTRETCGAGMANALNAVNEALRPIAAISAPATLSPGQSVTLQGGGSAASCKSSIRSWAWSVVSGSATLTGADSVNASLPAPSTEPVRIRLTVTDNAGRADSTHVTVNPSGAVVEGPQNAGATACLAPRRVPPFVTITATDDVAEEGTSGDTGTFTVTRSGSTTEAITVGVTYSGTATSGSDYTPLPDSVSFAAGATTATLNVVPVDDSVGELPETITASLQMGDGYSVASQSKATIALNDDDYQEVAIFASDGFSHEETADVGEFVVGRSGNTSRPLTVSLSYSGTATSGEDYEPLPGTATIAAGARTVALTLTPIDDAMPDNAETVVATLQASAAYVVNPGNAQASIPIRDSETPTMIIVATDEAASEQGPDGGTFVVRRNGPNAFPVTVNLEIVGTATAGADYQPVPTTVSMAAGQSEVSFGVMPIDDHVAEESESVIASLAPGAGYDLGIEASAIVRIADNDAATQQAPGTSARSTNGGGGVLDLVTLVAALLFAMRAVLLRRRASARATGRFRASRPAARPGCDPRV
jgi:hypothetical protein